MFKNVINSQIKSIVPYSLLALGIIFLCSSIYMYTKFNTSNVNNQADTPTTQNKVFTEKSLGISFNYPANWNWREGGQVARYQFYCENNCAYPNKISDETIEDFIIELNISTNKGGESIANNAKTQQTECSKLFGETHKTFMTNAGATVYRVCNEDWIQTANKNTIIVFRNERGDFNNVTYNKIINSVSIN